MTRFRVEMLIAGYVYLAALVIALAVGALWLRDDAKASVRVLGSGSSLSLLIVSEDARVLIAAGDDATAFGNALAGARHSTNRRIDLVVLAGGDDELAVAKKARNGVKASATLLVDGPLTAHLDELGLERDAVISRPLLMELPGGIDLTISPSTTRNGEWSALIQRGSTRLIAGDDPDAFARAGAVSASIPTDVSALTRAAAEDGTAILVPSRAIAAGVLRDAILDSGSSHYTIRIQPADVATLSFTHDGLRLPSSAIKFDDAAAP